MTTDATTIEMLRANLDAAMQQNLELHAEVATLTLRVDSQEATLRKAAAQSVKSADAMEEGGVVMDQLSAALEAAEADSIDRLHERVPFGCISFSNTIPNVTASIMNPKTREWASGHGDTVTEALQQAGKQ